MKEQKQHITLNELSEPEAPYQGFVHQSEEEKLLHDASRSDMEKFSLFTKMLRRNATLKKAIVPK